MAAEEAMKALQGEATSSASSDDQVGHLLLTRCGPCLATEWRRMAHRPRRVSMKCLRFLLADSPSARKYKHGIIWYLGISDAQQGQEDQWARQIPEHQPSGRPIGVRPLPRLCCWVQVGWPVRTSSRAQVSVPVLATALGHRVRQPIIQEKEGCVLAVNDRRGMFREPCPQGLWEDTRLAILRIPTLPVSVSLLNFFKQVLIFKGIYTSIENHSGWLKRCVVKRPHFYFILLVSVPRLIYYYQFLESMHILACFLSLFF